MFLLLQPLLSHPWKLMFLKVNLFFILLLKNFQTCFNIQRFQNLRSLKFHLKNEAVRR